MDKPILAAIIFTYNHAHMIAKCIESHINQKTEYFYEIRIYDDCSTDGTTEICQEFANKYPDKIKFFPQAENTFLMPYEKMQSYQAIQQIDTKYFCIIDGDDCWCDENKLQIALDFLENNPNYIGFAHDTMHIETFINKKDSWVHDLGKWQIENPVIFAATPFFFTSSRVFRNIGFAEQHLLPVDYILYFYHFSKGPIYYYDKVMANYYISKYNTFSNLEHKKQGFLLSTFAYKVAKFFDFKEDKISMDIQRYYNKVSGLKHHYVSLVLLKKVLGVRLGWNVWYFITFVPTFGLESMELNWVCPRKKVSNRVKNRDIDELKRKIKVMQHCERKIRKNKIRILIIKKILLFKNIIPLRLREELEHSLCRKYKRINDTNDILKKEKEDILNLKELIAKTNCKNIK